MKKITYLFAIVLTTLLVTTSICCKKKKGTADIKSTTFSVSSWAFSSPDYYTNLSVPDITSSNINSAAVNVYFSYSSGTWIAVPYTLYHSPYNYVMNFSSSVGNVQVTWFYDTSFSNGSDPNTYFGTTVQIKVVVVSNASRKANSDLNWNNYNEVKERFNLND